MALTAGQLEQLRKRPHKSRTWVGFVTPLQLFSCDVATGFSGHNVMTIPYENGSGDYTAIADGMLMEVYDSGELVGRVRIRSADASNLYVAENDEIDYADTQNVIVHRMFPLWTKFPIADVSGDEPVFYKDYNVAYTDQNQYPPPVPILGPALRFAFSGGAATASMTWDASASYSIRSGGSISTYAWEFEGGTPSTSSSPSQAVEYSATGVYLTKLTITDDEGKQAVAWRWIHVTDYIISSQLTQATVKITGDFRGGGWKADVRGFTDLSLSVLPDKSLVAIGVNTKDGDGNLLDFGGFDYCHDVYFCGYLEKDTIEQHAGRSDVRFSVIGIDKLMSSVFNFDVFVYDVDTTPADWLQIQELDVCKAGYHLLRWHSNLLELHDVYLPTTDTVRTQGIDAPQGDLFAQFRNMMQKVRYYEVGCDKQGAVYVQRNVQHMIDSERQSYGTNHTLSKADYQQPVLWPRSHRRTSAMLELQAVAFDGDDPSPYFSRAPGIVPIYEGNVDEVNGLAVADQSECNKLCGMFYSESNTGVKGANFKMLADWMPGLDVIPQAIVELPSSFTMRCEDLGGKLVVVRSVSFSVTDGGTPQVTWSVDLLVKEIQGRPFFYPEPEDLIEPPEDPPDPPPPDPQPPGSTKKVIVALYNAGVWQTSNFDDPSPNWSHINLGLVGTALDVNWFSRHPADYKAVGYLCTENGIFRNDTMHAGGTWTCKLTPSQLLTMLNAYDNDYVLSDAIFKKMKPQVSCMNNLYLIVAGDDATPGGYGVSLHYLMHSADRGETWTVDCRFNSHCDLNWYDSSMFHSWHSTTLGSEMNTGQLTPSTHNPLLVHAVGTVLSNSANQRVAYWRVLFNNDDYALSKFRWFYNAGSNSPNIPGAHIPFKNNPDDLRIYALRWRQGTEYKLIRWDQGGFPAGYNKLDCDSDQFEAGTDITPSFCTPGGNPALFGSYTFDKDWLWFCENTGVKVGRSEDGGLTWIQCTDLPFKAGVASGFPFEKSLFYVGRHRYGWATELDKQLLVVSDDAGVTWTDKTGDLFDEAWAYMGGAPGFKTSIVTIAPEW